MATLLKPSGMVAVPNVEQADLIMSATAADIWQRSTAQEFADRLLSGALQSVGATTTLAGVIQNSSAFDSGGIFTAVITNLSASAHGLRINAGGPSGDRNILSCADFQGTERFKVDDEGTATCNGTIAAVNESTVQFRADNFGGIISTLNSKSFRIMTGAAGTTQAVIFDGVTQAATFAGTVNANANLADSGLKIINPNVNGSGLLIQGGGTAGDRFILDCQDALGNVRFTVDDEGKALFLGQVLQSQAISGVATSYVVRQSRGTVASPIDSNDGDGGMVNFQTRNQGNFQDIAQVRGIKAGTSGGQIEWHIKRDTLTLTHRMTLTDQGQLQVLGLAGAGSRQVVVDANGVLSAP